MWRTGNAAPADLIFKTAVADGNTVYVSHEYSVYAYSVTDDEWSLLPLCTHRYFGLAVIDSKLLTIGGARSTVRATMKVLFQGKRGIFYSSLLSLCGNEWNGDPTDLPLPI